MTILKFTNYAINCVSLAKTLRIKININKILRNMYKIMLNYFVYMVLIAIFASLRLLVVTDVLSQNHINILRVCNHRIIVPIRHKGSTHIPADQKSF